MSYFDQIKWLYQILLLLIVCPMNCCWLDKEIVALTFRTLSRPKRNSQFNSQSKVAPLTLHPTLITQPIHNELWMNPSLGSIASTLRRWWIKQPATSKLINMLNEELPRRTIQFLISISDEQGGKDLLDWILTTNGHPFVGRWWYRLGRTVWLSWSSLSHWGCGQYHRVISI